MRSAGYSLLLKYSSISLLSYILTASGSTDFLFSQYAISR